MSAYGYQSIFKNEIHDYLSLRGSCGYKTSKTKRALSLLDTYLFESRWDSKWLSAYCVDGWLDTLRKDMSANTKNGYISNYSQFAKYLHSLEIPAFIPEYLNSDDSYVPYVFSPEELCRIFYAADNLKVQRKDKLRFAAQIPMLLRMLYGCGMRLGEALTLKTSDIDWENGAVTVRNAKTNKDRIVPVDSSLINILKKYCDIYCGNGALVFETEQGRQLGQQSVSYWFLIILGSAGIQLPVLPKYGRNICIHCFRHTFAVDSFRKQETEGIDNYSAAPLISVYMGHEKLTGTQRYLHMTAEISKDIYDKMNTYTDGVFPEVPV